MKFASRYLLPCEILLSVWMATWGLSAWIGVGKLAEAFQEVGISTDLGVVMCSSAILKFVVSGSEFAFGKGWSDNALFASVSLRCASAFLCLIVWFYLCYECLMATDLPLALLVQAPVAIVFNAWVYAGNMKVKCLLDKKVPTTKLQNTIIIERSKLLQRF